MSENFHRPILITFSQDFRADIVTKNCLFKLLSEYLKCSIVYTLDSQKLVQVVFLYSIYGHQQLCEELQSSTIQGIDLEADLAKRR